MEYPETVELFNTAPNGLRYDFFFLKKVPNPDNSGWEYLVEYQEYDFLGKFELGRCNMNQGKLRFPVTNVDLRMLGISHEGLVLLGNWLEANKFPL